jgi:hypothetical protein
MLCGHVDTSWVFVNPKSFVLYSYVEIISFAKYFLNLLLNFSFKQFADILIIT